MAEGENGRGGRSNLIAAGSKSRFFFVSLRRDFVQRCLFERLRDFIDAGENIRAVAGPFVRPIGEMAYRIANVLNSAFFDAFLQQFCELFE